MFLDNFQLSRYETWELDAMVQQIERPNPWLLQTFFPTEKLFGTASIEFDILDRGRRLAPFVSPLVAGKPTRREGYRTRQLTPAYLKPNDVVTPQDSFTRMPGEAYGGVMSPQARFDRLVTEKLDLYMEMVDNRLEWMAASALVNGGITIAGEDYPTVYVDFGRDPSLDIYLLGAAQWTKVTSDPIQDIESASIRVRTVSKGAVVTALVMDGQTWNVLKKNSEINDLINVFYRRALPGQTQTSIDAGPRTNINIGQYVGTLNGTIDLWVYDAYYQDDTGADRPYIPPYTVLGVAGPALEGRQYFGAILDLDAGIEPRKMFTKSKVKFNPSGLELLAQSAPLVAPRRPNAMFKMTVG